MPSPNSALPADVKVALQAAVKRLGTQAAVARDLGVSGPVVNSLLRDRYAGDVVSMANRIRGQYMAETVQCPVMGELSRRHCLDNQALPLAFTNPRRTALHAACKTCPNRKV